MGLRKAVNGAVAGMATKLGLAWALGQVRAAAEGRLGPEWQARYWKLEGKKTITGLVFALVAVVLAALGYTDASALVGLVSGLAVSAGLLDKAWRTQRPAWLTGNRVYQVLAAHSGWLTVAFSTAFALIQAGECGGLDCAIAGSVLLALAAAAVWAGLLDATWRAAPPIVRRADGRWVIEFVEFGKGGPRDNIEAVVTRTRADAEAAWSERQASKGA